MLLSHLVTAMEGIAPVACAEPWDNVGLLVGDPNAGLYRVLLTIDCTPAVLAEAIAGAYDTVVAYHPVIFKPLKRVVAGSVVWNALRHGIAVYSPHTALDIAPGGTNDVLARAVGIQSPAPLRALTDRRGADGTLGMGRWGALAEVRRAVAIQRVRDALGLSHVLVAGPTEGVACSAAVGAGACGDLIHDALARGVDLYVTGELRHHDALAAAAAGMTVVCTLHSHSERATLATVQQRLAAKLPGVEVTLSTADRDPFHIG